MADSEVEKIKKEIADCYIKQFQKELWWLKSISILPIKPSIKKILIWKKELPEKFVEIENTKFWNRIIQFLSPRLANQIFDFLKIKRQEIVSRQTLSELTKLKEQILWIDNVSSNWWGSDGVWNWGSNTSTENWNWWWSSTWVASTNTDEDWNWGNNSQSESVDNGENSQDEYNEDEHDDGEDEEGHNEDEHDEIDVNPVAAWVATSAAWVYGTYKMKQLFTKVEGTDIIKNLDEAKLKSTLDSAVDTLKRQEAALWSRLTDVQKRNISKYIRRLESWSIEIDWSGDLLKAWSMTWGKIPKELLKGAGIDGNTLKKIDDLADEIAGAKNDISKVKDILSKNWINDVDESIIKCLSSADTSDQLKAMTKVFRWPSKVKKIVDTLAWALRLDMAFAWLDVWVYFDENREADLIDKINEVRWANKHNQASSHLFWWLSSIAIEGAYIIISCLVTWSYWWPLWVAVWLAAWAIARGWMETRDALYYNVKDFYTQNYEDFLRQTRWELKQAILQWIHNYKMWDTSTNEKFTTYWNENHPDFFTRRKASRLIDNPDLSPWSEIKMQSLNSACRAMILLEELEIWDLRHNGYITDFINSKQNKEEFLKDKDKDYIEYFNKYRDEMQNRIDIRMKYVEKEFEKSDVIDAIYNGRWAQNLTDIFTRSMWYANMLWNEKRDDNKTYDENLLEYKNYLFSEFPAKKLEALEAIKKEHENLFLDIVTTISPDKFVDNEEEADENYCENVRLVEKYKEYIKLDENIEDKRYLNMENNHRNYLFIQNLLKNDFDLNKVPYPTMEKDTLLNLVWLWAERRWISDISDNLLQNILFRVARELHWYAWNNDMYSLLEFYDEWLDDVHWVYYTNGRKINDDRAIDRYLVNNLPDVIIKDEDVDKYTNEFIDRNFNKDGLFHLAVWPIFVPIFKNRKEIIDTPTESVDSYLTTELIDVFKDIVREELSCRTINNQNRIKKEIINIVKQNSKWEYIELPYYVILEAKRAWLWDLQRQFFRWNDNVKSKGSDDTIDSLIESDAKNIEICYLDSEYNNTSLFEWCKKSYISSVRTEAQLTAEEKYLMNRVDDAIEKVKELRNVQWLWLPIDWANILEFALNNSIHRTTQWMINPSIDIPHNQEDDLDLPIDVEHIISEKIVEWDTFKRTILMYDAGTCCTSQVIDQYTNYAEYFECLYRWILASLATFSVSDDIDKFSYFEGVMWYWFRNLLDDDLKLNLPEENGDKWFKVLYTAEFKDFYSKMIDELTVWDETIRYLRIRWWDEERNIAKQVANLIITTVLENSLLKRDSSWKLTYIGIGTSETIDYSEIEQELKQKVSKMKVEKTDEWAIQLSIWYREIRELSEWESRVTDLTPLIEELIVENLPEVDWKYERLKLRYDADNSMIESWWQRTKVLISEKEDESWNKEFESIKISWLDSIEFTDIKEWIRVANLLNRLKHNMENEPIGKPMPRLHSDARLGKYKRESWSLMREVSKSPNDIEILRKYTLNKYYPTIKDSNEFLEFINRLLESISSNNWWFGDYDAGWEEREEEPE